MAKKTKVSSASTQNRLQRIPLSFDLEKKRWFTPAAFGLMAVGVIILFSDFIFSSEMLRGSDMIQAGIFFRSFLVDHVLAHGSVPQWNPYIFGGMPYVEAFHGDIFYPLSILKYAGSLYRTLGMVMVLHIFLAGVFTYLTARQLRLSKTAALFSGVCYMFAAYLVSLVSPGHDGKIFVTALFPLTILFLDRGFQSSGFLRSFFNFSLLGLVLGVIILSPHPQMSFYSMWAIAAFAAFRLAMMFKDKKPLSRLARPAVLSVYAVLIGLMVSAIQFYPGYWYTTHFSPRAADDSKSGWEWATSWSMHEEEAMSQFIPEFAGTSSQSEKTYYWGKNYFKDNSESAGVVAIFVSLIGLFFVRRRDMYFFSALALLAFIYALGATTPLFRLFYYVVPMVKSLRAPSMIMFLFSFSIAIVAGMGIDVIKDISRESKIGRSNRFRWLLFGLPSALLLLAIALSANGRGMLSAWCSVFYSDAPQQMVQQGISKLDIAYANLPAIKSGAWMSFLFTGLTALGIWAYRNRKAGATVLVALALVPMINGIRFDKRFISTVDARQHWAPNEVTRFLSSRPEKSRVMDLAGWPPDLLPYFGVEVVEGYHGNQLRWYDKLLGGPAKTNRGNPRFLNLVGAKYLLVPSGGGLPGDYFGPLPLAIEADFGQFRIMRNDNALPRVYLADRYTVIGDRHDIYPRVLKGDDDLRRIVYLEQEPAIDVTADSLATGVVDSAWILSYSTDSVTVNTNTTRNQLLVMTDNYFDAWKVFVDGEPAPLLRAYGSFRAVAVPAGTRQVLFKYQSERYATGRTITLATTAYLFVVIAGCLLAFRREERPEGEVTE